MIQALIVAKIVEIDALYLPIQVQEFLLFSPLSFNETGCNLFVHIKEGEANLWNSNGKRIAVMRGLDIV
jgi:hypothetical protein